MISRVQKEIQLNQKITPKLEELGHGWRDIYYAESGEQLPQGLSEELKNDLSEFTALRRENYQEKIRIYDISVDNRFCRSRGAGCPTIEEVDGGANWTIHVSIGKIKMKGRHVQSEKYEYAYQRPAYTREVPDIVQSALDFIGSDQAPAWAGGNKVGRYGP